jgi:hypothetical protein
VPAPTAGTPHEGCIHVYTESEWILGQSLSDALTGHFSGDGVFEVADAVLADLSPPELPSGRLRPPVSVPGTPFSIELARALKLLLYAHEVVMEPPAALRGDPFAGLASAFRYLAAIRPLVENGAIVLGDASRQLGSSQSLLESIADTIAAIGPGGMKTEDRSEWEAQIFMLAAWPGRITPLLRNDVQREAVERLLSEFLSRAADRRALQLPKLAAIELPDLSLHVSDIVTVRNTNEVFADWRHHLGDALAEVELLTDSDAWQQEARAIISDELRPYSDRLRAEVKRSTALSAAVTGVRTLAIASIGSAVSVAETIESPILAAGGLGASAAASLGSGLLDWLKARREAIPKRAACSWR